MYANSYLSPTVVDEELAWAEQRSDEAAKLESYLDENSHRVRAVLGRFRNGETLTLSPEEAERLFDILWEIQVNRTQHSLSLMRYKFGLANTQNTVWYKVSRKIDVIRRKIR